MSMIFRRVKYIMCDRLLLEHGQLGRLGFVNVLATRPSVERDHGRNSVDTTPARPRRDGGGGEWRRAARVATPTLRARTPMSRGVARRTAEGMD